jgi:F-type H+-transporting ATPase subunit epsilon
MAALFNFEVHTPQKRFFDSKAQAIVLPLLDGEKGVYAKHSAFIAVSVTGILRIKDINGNWRSAFVSGGILEVKEYKNILMVDIAEWPEEIDRESVLAAREQAEEKLKNAQFRFAIDNAKEELRRADFRLKVLEMGSKSQN